MPLISFPLLCDPPCFFLKSMFSERYKNIGVDCWNGCSSKEGRCAWCGTEGMCCRLGWTGNGCDGNMGIEGHGHVCGTGTVFVG